MPNSRPAVATLALAVLVCSASSAAAAPPFPNSYRGTITGSAAVRDDNKTIKASWTVKGVVLRRTKVKKTDASWVAYYAVKGGKISYHETETGSCSYTFDLAAPLRTSLSTVSAPLALSQSLFFNHKTTALGSMGVKKTYTTTETCQQPDGAPPIAEKRKLYLPALFDPGEAVVKLGKRFAGKNGYKDDFNNATTKWSWVLKP